MRNPRDMYADLQDRDPTGLWGTVGALVGALIALASAFGVDIPPDAEVALLRVVAIAGPLATALFASGRMPGQSEGAWAPRSVHEVEHPPEGS